MSKFVGRRWDRALLGSTAALLLAFAASGLREAWSWVDEPFPGFLVLENRVVASVGLAHWPATSGGEIYQHEILAVDGVALTDASQLAATVREVPVGTEVRYRLRRGETVFERAIPTRRFERADFGLLFGTYLLNGFVLGGTALVLLACRRRHPEQTAAVPMLLIGALWGLTAMDLYGPYRLFRLHALAEAMMFGAAIHMALGFPRPLPVLGRYRWLPGAAYGLSLGVALVYQLGLRQPESYVNAHLLSTSALGASLLVLLTSQMLRYLRAASPELRRRLRSLAAGAALALALPVVLTLAETLTGGTMPQNAVGFTTFVFPLSIAYAALRRSPRGPQGGIDATGT